MNPVVYKYTLLNGQTEHQLTLPIGAQMLCVQEQFGQLQLWALVDANQVMQETRHLFVIGTGITMHPSRAHYRYLNTVQLHGGSLVLHAFADR